MSDNISAIVNASRPVRIAATVALGALALFLFLLAIQEFGDLGRSTKPVMSTITVTGTGKSTSAPNRADISFSVQETASTVAAAQDAATKRTNDALAAMKELGIEDKDVKTTGYSVYPQYATTPCPIGSYCPQSNKISGYQVMQTIEVKVRDINKVGDVLQKLGALGVQNIYGPNFMVDDDSSLKDEARGQAIDDAKEKAELLAKQLGVRLGKVVSYSEMGGAYPMYSAYGKGGMGGAMDAVAQAAPAVPTGQNETEVNVNITYEIR